MKIFIKSDAMVSFNGINYDGGQVIDLPLEAAEAAVMSGAAMAAGDSDAAASKTKKKSIKTEESVNVD